ncbi:Extracellular sulfatase Sulf-1 [Nymphon striatum]|nr:Extracellular sulfatase Sulf-1 [Nymphon striatum]
MQISVYILVILLCGSFVVAGKRKEKKQFQSRSSSNPRAAYWNDKSNIFGHKYSRSRTSSSPKKAPNIIFIITDDQDIELGSMNYMKKTLKILGEGGAHFPNAFVTTPMCCPSRSSMLTGMYVHNHNVYTNNDNCSSPMWQQTHETRSFSTYLNNAGYRTGYFGKYLNEYNGDYIPPGYREWMALIRNSRFYNYSINLNGNKIKHGDDYNMDYFPDLIANDSIAFLRMSKQFFSSKPIMMTLSFPSPHGPEDAAPQYSHMFMNVTSHRTPSWNYAPNPDKQWILRYTRKMEPIHIKFTDFLHSKRLQTLQSVDVAVERIYNELVKLGELDNTYIFYTSDHGYHLGQFGLIKGKAMPFEFDIKVPFYVRGPGVPRGIRIPNMVLNIDLAPTFLDIGRIDVPEHMDGKSILRLLKHAQQSQDSGQKLFNGEVKRRKAWRDTFLVERGRWRVKKCRKKPPKKGYKDACICPPRKHGVNRYERKNQKKFLKQYVDKGFQPVFIGSRSKREAQFDWDNVSYFDTQAVYNLNTLLDLTLEAEAFNNSLYHNVLDDDEDVDFEYEHIVKRSTDLKYSSEDCEILKQQNISCQELESGSLRIDKKNINKEIKILRERIEKLKGLRRQLKEKRPYDKGTEYEKNLATTKRPICDCTESYNTLRHNKRKMLREERKRSWDEKMKRLAKKQRKKQKFNKYLCNAEKMNCFTHDNNHWKSPPLWTDGPFCFCQNANNNTYWCLRTINETHNFLYCEFITGFLCYYNLKTDPYQLRNQVFELDVSVLEQLRLQLIYMRKCKGAKECTVRYRKPPRATKETKSTEGEDLKHRGGNLAETSTQPTTGDVTMATRMDTIVTSTFGHQLVDDLLAVGSGNSEFPVDGSGEIVGSGGSEFSLEELGRKVADNVYLDPNLKQKSSSVLKFVKDEQFIPAESS